jgi:hypothetical protein
MSPLTEPAAIEKKIDEIIFRASGTNQRTSLLTLVIVAPKRQTDFITHALDFLFGKRPMRIIIIESGGDAPTSVDVSARCTARPEGDEVCFQEIAIHNGKDNRGIDPSFWSPLIIRDLPAALLWLDSFTLFPGIIEEAEHFIDKCIIDSALMTGPHEDPLKTLRLLSSLFAGPNLKPESMSLADLCWKRLERERLSIARLFDDPDALALLGAVTRISFRGFNTPEALCLVFWIASRLNYSRSGQKGNTISFKDAGGKEIVFDYSAGGPEAPSVSFMIGKKESLRVAYADNGDFLFTTPGRTYTARLPKRETAELLLKEIDNLHHDPLYYDALRLTTELG